jgi:NADPH2:quinone reductase
VKAAYIEKTGEPGVIQYGERPDPEPAATQVLVRVAAVAVNPIDTYVRSGAVALPLEFPYIIGCDLAGTVLNCGSGATRFQPGDRVWGSNQGLFGRPGTFAELAAVDEEWLYATPAGMSDEVAAAGSLVGITAHLGLFRHAGLQAGETVFVNGGTGGVGAAVVQLAKAAGARVITTAGTEEKRGQCREWGADAALDYRAPTLDDEIRAAAEATGGVQVWFETQREPTLDRTINLMAKGGRIVLMAGRDARPDFPLGAFYVNNLSMHGFAMFNSPPEEQRVAAEAINRAFENSQWHPHVGRVFPLEQAAEAHRLQEENTLHKQGTLAGKIVLVP